MKITQEDLNLIPKKLQDLRQKQSTINAENTLMLLTIDTIRSEFDEGRFEYVDKLVKTIEKDIEINNDFFGVYQKKLVCPHNVEDLKWECEGHDSHKDYYKCRCTICDLEINSIYV